MKKNLSIIDWEKETQKILLQLNEERNVLIRFLIRSLNDDGSCGLETTTKDGWSVKIKKVKHGNKARK